MPQTKKKSTRGKQEPSPNGHFIDGTITIEVQGGPHDGKTITMDASVVSLASVPLEKKHKLVTKGEQIHATAEFLVDLDAKLKSIGYESTPTIALHAWIKASEYLKAIQKKTSV